MEGKAVYEAISNVQAEMASIGIVKDKKNAQQGYNFRGIDDVYNALAPILAKHKLCILPRVLSRQVSERQSSKGNALFYVCVECEFDLVSAIDGSMHTIKTYGEAMDSADKGTNKAMSAAYKYAAFQTFCIPVDVEDADATTPEVGRSKKESKKQTAPTEEKKATPLLDPKSPLHKKLEASIAEAGIDREKFKEWLESVGWLAKVDGRLSFTALTLARVMTIVDKWSSCKDTYMVWLDARRIVTE